MSEVLVNQKKERTKMHIKINKSALAEALNNVASVVASKTSLPVLQNVKITARDGKALFVCSDLDTTLIANAECEVLEDGETTIPAKMVSTAVSKVVDGVIDLDVDERDRARLTAGTSKFSFNGISAKEFPVLKEEGGDPVTLKTDAIRELLRKTSFAMCMDDTRKVLNSVLLDFSQGGGKTIAVATDGRRLSMLNCTVEAPATFNSTFVLPRKAVDVLSKKLPKDGDCKIISTGSQLRFVTQKFELYTKLFDDAFPNYMQVVPKTSNEIVVVDRVELIGALDRVSVFTNSDAPTVQLTFDNGRMILTSDTESGSSRDEVAIKYEGDKIEMKFNPQYIRDALNVIDEDEVEIRLINETSPAVIRKSGSDDYTYVVMPLRIN